MRNRIVFVCYSIATVLLALSALLYLSRWEFLPYHAAAVGKTWQELDPSLQTLLLALIKVSGGGWLAASVAMAVMLHIPFRQGQAWACWAIPLTGICTAAPTLYATLLVTFNTPGLPPWYVPAAIILLLLGGLVISLGTKSNQPD